MAALALGTAVATALLDGVGWSLAGDEAGEIFLMLAKRLAGNAVLPVAQARRASILEELESGVAGGWAGNYVHSDGCRRWHLVLGRERFVYEFDDGSGLQELAFGTVASVEGARIQLDPGVHLRVEPPGNPYPWDFGRRFDFETDLVAVRWGAEQFLVPARRMDELCQVAADVDDPDRMRSAQFLRRQIDAAGSNRELVDLVGLPEVPAEFRHLLAPK